MRPAAGREPEALLLPPQLNDYYFLKFLLDLVLKTRYISSALRE